MNKYNPICIAQAIRTKRSVSTLLGLCCAMSISTAAVAQSPVAGCPSRVGNLPVTPLPMISESGKAVCEISGVLETDGTLISDVDWHLEGVLQIGYSGYYPILTIDPGTDIFGDNVGETDYVYVYAGASIQANGTSRLPVRFLSDDAGFDGAGEWGGIYIAGDGDMQGDNLLDYVVVAEGGAEFTVNGSTYRDNIVIQGADDGTRLTFVQSHDSARDGIWVKDSSARMSWILVTGARRDGIWYRNYNGLVKDLMVLHRPDSGRSGIYASATELRPGISNPRFVNVTLFDMDTTIESAASDPSKREFGILFADYVIEGEFANVNIGNWKHGCYEVEPTANLTGLVMDGVHCTHNWGNTDIGVIRDGGVDFPNVGTGNGDGFRYYDGTQNRLLFTGDFAERKFTAGWYVNKIGDLTNGLAADANALAGFRDGDTNGDGVVDGTDVGASPLFGFSGLPLTNPIGDSIRGFNDDVAGDTNGYDLTHNGAVRSGSDASAFQWNGWTVSTGPQQGFCAMDMPEPPSATQPTPTPSAAPTAQPTPIATSIPTPIVTPIATPAPTAPPAPGGNGDGVFGITSSGAVYHSVTDHTGGFVYICLGSDCRVPTQQGNRWVYDFGASAGTHTIEFKIQDNTTGQCITVASGLGLGDSAASGCITGSVPTIDPAPNNPTPTPAPISTPPPSSDAPSGSFSGTSYGACVDSSGRISVAIPGHSSGFTFLGGYVNGRWFFGQAQASDCSADVCQLNNVTGSVGDSIRYFCQGDACDSDLYYPGTNNTPGDTVTLQSCN